MKAIYILGGIFVVGAGVLAVATLRGPAQQQQQAPPPGSALEGAAARGIDALVGLITQSYDRPTRTTASVAHQTSAVSEVGFLTGDAIRGLIA